MDYKVMLRMLFRYIVLLIVALFSLPIIDRIFTPLTVYPSFYLLKIFYSDAFLYPAASRIIANGENIMLIEACIAGAAYYLLLVINLATPMKHITRIKSLIFLMLSFLTVNIIRIDIFSVLLISGYKYFDVTHLFVWYFGSTIFVVCLWFINAWLFKIRNIPGYSDLRQIGKDLKR